MTFLQTYILFSFVINWEFEALHLEDKPREEVESTQKSILVSSHPVLDYLSNIKIYTLTYI
jgi:hypothetical protein